MSNVKETSLQLLNTALFVLFAVVGALAAVYVTLNRVLLLGLLSDIELVARSGERQVVMQELLLDSQSLVLSSQAISDSQDRWDGMVRRLEVHRSEYAEIHNELYIEAAESSGSKTAEPNVPNNFTQWVQATSRGYSQAAIDSMGLNDGTKSSVALHSLYVKDVLPVRNLQAGEEVVRPTGLLDAGVEFGTKVRLSEAIDPSQWALYDRSSTVFFVRANGPESVAAGANESSLLLHKRTEEHKERNELIELCITMSSIGILMLSLICIVIPIIVGVEGARDGIHRIFFHVPRKVVKFLRNDAQKRLDDIQAEEDGIDDDATGGYQDAVVSVRGDHAGSGQGGHGTGSQVDDMDWSKIRFKKNHADERESTKDSSRVILNLVRFCMPVLVAAACFALLREWTTASFDAIERLDNAVYYSEQRHAAVLQLEYYVARTLESETTAAIDFYASAVNDRAAAVIRLQNGLLYGSEVMHVDGTLKTSDTMHHLMLEDGCLSKGGGFSPASHATGDSAPESGQNETHFALA